MAKRIASIRKDNPDLAVREDVKAIANDVDLYASLNAFATSDAGDILIKSLIKDMANSIADLIGGYRTLSHVELMALCARLEAREGFIKSLHRAQQNLDLANEALKELTS